MVEDVKTGGRKLTGAFFQSLDGVIQGGGGPEEDRSGGFRFGGWTVPYSDESANEAMGNIYDKPEYDLLLARRTYEIFSAYWPYNRDDPIGAKFQRINKYVLTHSEEPLEWEGSQRLSGDAVTAVTALKNTAGRDLLIQGSSSLYQPLLAAGLIDRLIVMTFPVVLGKGKRILGTGDAACALKLVDHFISDTGVVFATYDPAGAVQTGTFETRPPSSAEQDRRKRWALADTAAGRRP